MSKNKKKLIITGITAAIFTISCCFSSLSYAKTKSQTAPSSAKTANPAATVKNRENKPADTKNKTQKDGVTSKTQQPKAAGVLSMSVEPPEEIFSGSVGKAGMLSPLLSESFQTDLATGSATANISFVVPPGRKNMQPSLALSYSSNNPNGVCGVGWALTSSSIQRSTKKGPPKYDDTDTFIFASSGSSGELIPLTGAPGEYRQKIETAFMKYVFDAVNSKWTVRDKAGTKYIFGSVADSRITDAAGTKIFAWFLDKVEDVYGNTVSFAYIKDGAQVYASRIDYTGNAAVSPALAADKSVEFVYEAGRPDVMYSYRSGWEIKTVKRLKEVCVKVDGAVAWRYILTYAQSADTKRSLLSQVDLSDTAGNSLPPKKFKYQTIE